MNPKQALLILLVLAVLTFAPFPGPAQASETGPDHSYDCGPNVPPSGTYLDVGVLVSFHYDCQTGALTPKETNHNNNCEGTNTLAGGYLPLHGFCLAVNQDPNSDSRYHIDLYVAVVGQYDTIQWEDDTDDFGSLHNCNAAPCYTTSPCMTDLFVTFCEDYHWHDVNCAQASGFVWITGTYRAYGDGFISGDEASNEAICRD